HNLAILFWITANCTWMIGEFFGWDEGTFGLRRMALIPFGFGLAILAVYYILYFTQKRFRDKVVQQTEQVLEEEMHHNEEKKTA
ncbi:MAG: hypothetical protein KGZ74_06585, partial [Chitinophagaceae bacterium]|nr:hypothetical protein [Chitinophagaceae bacterium]